MKANRRFLTRVQHVRLAIARDIGVPLVISLVFLTLVIRGLDFGRHWDEAALIDKVEWSVANGGVLLPPTYDWPSASYGVALMALAPEVTGVSGVSADALSRFEQQLLATLTTDAYLLRLRLLFAILTALSVIWVFAASRALGGGIVEAGLAAAILALAWEPSYHARFAAPDGLLMQFGALALWFTVLAAREPASRWWIGAAIAAGFAVGTKYSAWPLLVPVAWLAIDSAATPIGRARRIAALAAAFFAAFLMTTPGALLMPIRFIQALVSQTRHYAGGHGVHTVDAGLDHLWRMGEYLTFELLSPFAIIGLAFTGCALLGAVALARRGPRFAVAVLAFPSVFVLYFAAQRVMIVRNLLILAPFFAVIAARGIAWTVDSVPGRTLRAVPYAAAVCALLVNAVFGVRAAASIERRRSIDFGREARAWFETSSRDHVGVSSDVRRALGSAGGAADQHDANKWLTFLDEPVCGQPIPANVRGLVTLVAGAREINVTRYPDWTGDRHLVVIDLDRLRRYGRCTTSTE